jgi:hypothetical protein
MPKECNLLVDGPARVMTQLSWLDGSQPGGFVYETGAFLVPRSTQELRFQFVPGVPAGVPLSEPVQIKYRLWKGPLAEGSEEEKAVFNWTDVAASSAVTLRIESLLFESHATTLLRVEWRTKEKGFVWSAHECLKLILLATGADSPTISASPYADWQMGNHWHAGPARDAAIRQVHKIEIRKYAADARLIFGVGTSLPSLLLDANQLNASSMRDGALVETFESQLWSSSWSPDDLPQQCSNGTQVSTTKLCSYSRPFQVLAGETVFAFALQSGKLESEIATLKIPIEIEAGRGNQAFQATTYLEGSASAVSGTNVFVLSSVASTLTFSVDQDALERQTCVLVSHLDGLGEVASHGNATLGFSNCSWLGYKSKRTLDRNTLYEQLGYPTNSTKSLNLTILTTVKKPGFLWSYPRVAMYLWLRERAAPPAVETVLTSDSVPVPAAMVWLPEATGAAAQSSRCLFSVHYLPITEEMIVEVAATSLNWLHAVPDQSRSVNSVADAIEATGRLSNAKQLAQWRSNVVAECAWPVLCELPLSGNLPAELIKTSSSVPYVCAWAILPGYSESEPKCGRIVQGAEVKKVVPNFIQTQDLDLQGQTEHGVVEEIGRDARLGAKVLHVSRPYHLSHSSGRRLAWIPQTLSYHLDRQHPLKFRSASVAEDMADLACISMTGGCSRDVLGDLKPSVWENLSNSIQQVPFPLHRNNDQHVLFQIDTQFMTGIDSWSQEEHSLAVALLGEHPPLEVSEANRTVTLKTSRNGSKVLYRWTLDRAVEPQPKNGTSSFYSLQRGFTSINNAYTLNARINCNWDLIDATLQLRSDEHAGPTLCLGFAHSASPLVLEPPDWRQWGLWAAAYSEGLGLSPHITRLICKDGMIIGKDLTCIEANCEAPSQILHAAVRACSGLSMIASGGTCIPQCQDGYHPSEAKLVCREGILSPANFTCSESPCPGPSGIRYAPSPPCKEGALIRPGEQCTPWCHKGFAASEVSLTCAAGKLSPSTFACDEIPCSMPADIAHGETPSCHEGHRIDAGATCTARCQSGYMPSHAMLSCANGTLTPTVFACEEQLVSSDSVILIMGITLGLCLFGACVCAGALLHHKRSKLEFPTEEPVDPLQEWLDCLNEVEIGTCVFCGTHAITQQGTETSNGPATTHLMCNSCASVLNTCDIGLASRGAASWQNGHIGPQSDSEHQRLLQPAGPSSEITKQPIQQIPEVTRNPLPHLLANGDIIEKRTKSGDGNDGGDQAVKPTFHPDRDALDMFRKNDHKSNQVPSSDHKLPRWNDGNGQPTEHPDDQQVSKHREDPSSALGQGTADIRHLRAVDSQPEPVPDDESHSPEDVSDSESWDDSEVEIRRHRRHRDKHRKQEDEEADPGFGYTPASNDCESQHAGRHMQPARHDNDSESEVSVDRSLSHASAHSRLEERGKYSQQDRLQTQPVRYGDSQFGDGSDSEVDQGCGRSLTSNGCEERGDRYKHIPKDHLQLQPAQHGDSQSGEGSNSEIDARFGHTPTFNRHESRSAGNICSQQVRSQMRSSRHKDNHGKRGSEHDEHSGMRHAPSYNGSEDESIHSRLCKQGENRCRGIQSRYSQKRSQDEQPVMHGSIQQSRPQLSQQGRQHREDYDLSDGPHQCDSAPSEATVTSGSRQESKLDATRTSQSRTDDLPQQRSFRNSMAGSRHRQHLERQYNSTRAHQSRQCDPSEDSDRSRC